MILIELRISSRCFWFWEEKTLNRSPQCFLRTLLIQTSTNRISEGKCDHAALSNWFLINKLARWKEEYCKLKILLSNRNSSTTLRLPSETPIPKKNDFWFDNWLKITTMYINRGFLHLISCSSLKEFLRASKKLSYEYSQRIGEVRPWFPNDHRLKDHLNPFYLSRVPQGYFNSFPTEYFAEGFFVRISGRHYLVIIFWFCSCSSRF